MAKFSKTYRQSVASTLNSGIGSNGCGIINARSVASGVALSLALCGLLSPGYGDEAKVPTSGTTYTANSGDVFREFDFESGTVTVTNNVIVTEINGKTNEASVKIGNLNNSGMIQNIDNATIGKTDSVNTGLANNGTIIKITNGDFNGSLTNNSGGNIIDVNGGTFNAKVDNQGTIANLNAGTFSESGSFTNATSGKISSISTAGDSATGPTFKNGLTNNGLIGVINKITIEDGKTIENKGSIANIAGDVSSTIVNSGAINKISSGTITTLDNNKGGSLVLNGGTISTLNNNTGGSLTLTSGEITNDFNNSGTITDITGKILKGNLTNKSGGVIEKISSEVWADSITGKKITNERRYD